MTHRSTMTGIRPPIAALAVLLLVAGCGSSAGTNPASGGPSGVATSEASPATSRAPSAPASTRPSVSPTSSGKATIAGTITWDATRTSRTSPDSSEVWEVSGTMDLVLDEDLGQFVAMPGKSTYSYDLEHRTCSPKTHEEGTLETAIQTFPDDGVAQALIFGPVGQTFDMQVFFDDSWVVTCPNSPALPEDVIPNAFPGCTPQGKLTVTFDGTGSYSVDCDSAASIDNGGIVVTGHVSGTLSPS